MNKAFSLIAEGHFTYPRNIQFTVGANMYTGRKRLLFGPELTTVADPVGLICVRCS